AWVDAWRGAARLDYSPSVNIQAVKPKKRRGQEAETGETGISDAIQETLKYAVKPGDMLADNGDWFLELTRQTHKLRFIATGGELKGVLKPETEIKNEDLVHPEGDQAQEEENTGPLVVFDWDRRPSRYKKRS
ncbi:MAG: protein rep, partial [Chromatiaceae bacterium]|nr:protein rep [Candidatus Thioaporhodococcus sediminis]